MRFLFSIPRLVMRVSGARSLSGSSFNDFVAQFVKNIIIASKIPEDDESTSLCSSTPILPLPLCFKDLVEESCIDPKSAIRYYQSRSVLGISDLQVATLNHYAKKGIDVSDAKCLFTPSEHDVVKMMIKMLKKQGGSVIMTIPTFGLFFNAFFNYKIPINLAKLTKDTDWKLTPKILRDTLLAADNPGLLVFINPDNPTGKSYSKEEIEALADEILSYNEQRKKEGKRPLLVLNDEASRRIKFTEGELFSLASVKGMEEYAITSSTSSKDLAPGLAISHAIGPRSVIDSMLDAMREKKIPDILSTDRGANYISQYFLAAILSGRFKTEFEDHVEKSIAIYADNLGVIGETIDDINEGLQDKFKDILGKRNFLDIVVMPDGGLQCLIQARGIYGLEFPDGYKHLSNPAQRTINSSVDLVYYLQETAKVRLLPGEMFGFDGHEMMFRVTISKDKEVLQDAFGRIKKSLDDLSLGRQSSVHPLSEITLYKSAKVSKDSGISIN